MDAWLDSTVQRIGDWLDEAGRWLGSIPDGVVGAVIGVIAMQIVTAISTYRRHRDEYRSPQRAAIGALLAAANELRIGVTETQDEVADRLIGVDQAFEVAFLTVVDGPCYDQLVAAEQPYKALKKIVNDRQADFMEKLGTASEDLDAELRDLVKLAQKRLRASRRLLSKKPTVTRFPKSSRERATFTERATEVDPDVDAPEKEDDKKAADELSSPSPDSEAAQQKSDMAPPKYGQKRVLATSIKQGDRVLWTKDGIDLMMVVATVTRATDDGMPCLHFSGMTYALSPGAVGETLSGTERGQADWTIPKSNMVSKSVPWAEADHGKP
jgi:hypothetical protein